MIEPPMPPDELQRLEALRSLCVLDTPPEERFDRITRLACHLFDVPIAVISLVDHARQWFKSRQGLDVCETPRSVSFCGHAILDPDVFVVPDARQDPRFADNPLVTGEPFVRFYAGQPLASPGGARVGTLCIIDRRPRRMPAADMERLRDLGAWVERELEDAEHRAQRALLLKAERLKNEFISTVSHELRTPLTSIRGSLGLLAGGVAGNLPPQAHSLIDIALSNSERLVRLINDLLDIEKIESGKMVFRLEPLEIGPLVAQAVAGTTAYAGQLGVRISLEDRAPAARVLADPDRLTQVLANLLSNAAKFSPAGARVEVLITRDQGSVRVAVTDRGPGIADDFRHRIFQKFAQADSSDTRQKGGTGLGLSISKAIIDRHGGDIGFDSRPGQGTTFFFLLPEWQPAPVEQRPRVLVCEDNADVATLLGMLLEQEGFDPVVAHSAPEARRLLAEQPFAAMTLDLALPGQDGIALLRELREQESTRSLPIIIVSASPELSAAELDGGALAVVDWLEKPIDGERLARAVSAAVHGRPASRPRILHVEDDASVVELVSLILNGAAEVVPAEGVEDARRRLEKERFDLVILDLALEDGSGWELLPWVRRPGKPAVPVVVFSGTDVGGDAARQVAAALVKSRASNDDLRRTIVSLISPKNP